MIEQGPGSDSGDGGFGEHGESVVVPHDAQAMFSGGELLVAQGDVTQGVEDKRTVSPRWRLARMPRIWSR